MGKKKRKNKKKKIEYSRLKKIKRFARELFGRIKGTQVIPDKTKYSRNKKYKKDWREDVDI